MSYHHYPLIQQLIAVFLLLSLCLQSCIPPSHLAYKPQGQESLPKDIQNTQVLVPEKANSCPPSHESGPCLELGPRPAIFNKQVFTSASGEAISFFRESGRWKATIENSYLGLGISKPVPVICATEADLGHILRTLPEEAAKQRIHILDTPLGKCIYVGSLGLRGGMQIESGQTAFPLRQAKNPQDDDSSIASHGLNNDHYWYSMADGMRLNLAIRKNCLNYENFLIKGTEEYSALRENHNRIFLANPYYIDNFATCLEDDVSLLLARWQQMPTMLLIPCLGGMHWRIIQVKIDYTQESVEICWDDPYGANHFPAHMRESILIALTQEVSKLIQKQNDAPSFTLTHKSIYEKDKKVDQQGSGSNDWDCGPIVFTNLKDYIDSIKNSGEVNYTIGKHELPEHAKQIIHARTSHYEAYCQVQEIHIDPEKLSSFKAYIEGTAQAKLKQHKETLATSINSTLELPISQLACSDLAIFFTILENKRLAENKSLDSIYREEELKYAYDYVIRQMVGSDNSVYLKPLHGINIMDIIPYRNYIHNTKKAKTEKGEKKEEITIDNNELIEKINPQYQSTLESIITSALKFDSLENDDDSDSEELKPKKHKKGDIKAPNSIPENIINKINIISQKYKKAKSFNHTSSKEIKESISGKKRNLKYLKKQR
jgi:hypothetical protein